MVAAACAGRRRQAASARSRSPRRGRRIRPAARRPARAVRRLARRFWVNVPLVVVAFALGTTWLPADARARSAAARAARAGLARRRAVRRDAREPAVVPANRVRRARLGAARRVCRMRRAARRPRAPRRPAARRRRMLAGNRPLVATYLRCIGTYMVFYAIFYSLPMWLQDVKHLAARDAGLVMLPISAFGTITTLVATRLTHRRGSRPVLVFGSAMLCVGCGVMALIRPTCRCGRSSRCRSCSGFRTDSTISATRRRSTGARRASGSARRRASTGPRSTSAAVCRSRSWALRSAMRRAIEGCTRSRSRCSP
ncbi:hypothetical protein A8H34_13715 [Burkholderia thailandensis]|nr:hypothetical protein A8H34_13715 [Burkholderia thailandensis]